METKVLQNKRVKIKVQSLKDILVDQTYNKSFRFEIEDHILEINIYYVVNSISKNKYLDYIEINGNKEDRFMDIDFLIDDALYDWDITTEDSLSYNSFIRQEIRDFLKENNIKR